MTKREKEKNVQIVKFFKWLGHYEGINTGGDLDSLYMKFKQSQKKKGRKG